jgi:SAM-dependent methyltransferase
MTVSAPKMDKDLFDRIASHYVQKDLVGYCRVARKLRLERTLRNIPLPVSSILEIGCGAGFTADYLRGRYTRYLGVDLSRRLIDYAKRHNSHENASFVCSSVEDLVVEEKFQVVLMIGVLHHLDHVGKVLIHLKEFIAETGVIVVNEPQRGNPLVSSLRALRKRLDHRYSPDQVEFEEDEIRALFRECGYRARIFPQGFLSTPLAETLFLPSFVGLPSALAAGLLDPVLERLFSTVGLSRWSWNMVVEARVR